MTDETDIAHARRARLERLRAGVEGRELDDGASSSFFTTSSRARSRSAATSG
jgi:hypothetical protein